MALIINNNTMANTAARNLNQAYNDLTKSTERLSSGMRINSAADDAAGLAVREMMRAEVTTLNQGVRNANDAISMIQTADGALSVIDEKLIRMNELAEQAATGTYTDEQREIIDQEYQTMAEEITRISDATDFNGTKLLDGSLDPAEGGDAMTIHFGTGNDEAEDKYSIEVENVSADAMGLGTGALDYEVDPTDGTVTTAEGNDIYTNADGDVFIDDGSAPVPSDYTQADVMDAEAINAADEAEAKALVTTGATASVSATVDAVTGEVTFGVAAAAAVAAPSQITDDGNGFLQVADPGDTTGATKTYLYKHTADDGTISYNTEAEGGELMTQADLADDLYEVDDAGGVTLGGTTVNGAVGSMTLAAGTATVIAVDQVENAEAKADLDKALAGTDEYAGSSILTQDGAAAALDAIGKAIEMKDKNRANLGAYENRLEATISNLEIQSENLSAAESRISDVDVATEMTEYTLRQTISQAATSMLAQANTLPETALQLING